MTSCSPRPEQPRTSPSWSFVSSRVSDSSPAAGWSDEKTELHDLNAASTSFRRRAKTRDGLMSRGLSVTMDNSRRARNVARSSGSGGFLLDDFKIGRSRRRQKMTADISNETTLEPEKHESTARNASISGPKLLDRLSRDESSSSGKTSNTWEQPEIRESHASEGVQDQGKTPQRQEQRSSRVISAGVPQSGTEPSTIVNLALSLNEGRRRQASLGRVPTTTSLAGRSATSRALPSAVIASPDFGASLRKYVDDRRRPRVSSARSSYSFQVSKEQPASDLRFQADPALNGSVDGPATVVDSQESMKIMASNATLLRADKARLWLDLFYEYRKLLGHLPELPSTVNTNSQPLKKMVERSDKESSEGRPYNPLQYIRNRKVRGRQRNPNSFEGDAWKDIGRVRDWVSQVAEEGVVDGTESNLFSLPTFHTSGDDLSSPLRSSDPNRPGKTAKQVTKTARRRTDWEITPWDMLADVYWLSQETNIYSIEDKNGNKPPAPREHVSEAREKDQEAYRESRRASANISRTSLPLNNLSRTQSLLHGDDNDHRGRRRQQQLREQSTHAEDYSSSRDRKGKWSRRLVRSQSSSSSEASAIQSSRGLWALQRQLTSREKYDNAILDRQMMDLWLQENKGTRPVSISMDDFSDFGSGQSQIGSPDRRESIMDGEQRSPKEAGSLDAQNDVPGFFRHRMHFSSASQGFEDLNSSSAQKQLPSIAISLSPSKNGPRSQRRPLHKSRLSLDTSVGSKTGNGQPHVEEIDFADNPSDHAGEREPRDRQAPAADSTSDNFLSPNSAKSFGIRLNHYAAKERDRKIESPLVGSTLREKEIDLPLGRLHTKTADKANSNVTGMKGSDHPMLFSSPSSYTSEASETDESSRKGFRRSLLVAFEGEKSSSRQKSDGEESRYKAVPLPIFRSPFRKSTEKDKIRVERHRNQPKRSSSPGLLQSRSLSHSPDRTSLERSSSSPVTPADSKNDDYGFISSNEKMEARERRYAMVDEIWVDKADKLPSAELTYTDRSTPIPLGELRTGQNNFWWFSYRPEPLGDRPVTAKDLARLEILMESLDVKGKGISMHVEEASQAMITQLQMSSSKSAFSEPKKVDITAAGIQEKKVIEDHHNALREAATKLSSETVSDLHERVRLMDDRITSSLIQFVRSSADKADRLNSELLTSRMLDIKQLNDSIDLIVRRKRRRLRWLRRGGYFILEWALLGFMWWIWLIVVIARLFIGLLSGLFVCVRWLLWL